MCNMTLPKFGYVFNIGISWKIRLLDDNGHYMNQDIKTNTRWKYYDVKTIKNIHSEH